MDDIVVCGVIQGDLELVENLVEKTPQVVDFLLGNILEMARVMLGNDPDLEWEAAGEGAKRGEVRRVVDDPLFERELLLDHIAVDAAAAVVEELERAGHFLPDRNRNDRRDDQLAVGVLEAGAAGGARVLEEHAVHEAAVALQVDQTVAVDPEDFADILGVKRGHAGVVAGAFDDHFMGADAFHQVVNAISALVEAAFNLQGWEAVGDDTDTPPWAV